MKRKRGKCAPFNFTWFLFYRELLGIEGKKFKLDEGRREEILVLGNTYGKERMLMLRKMKKGLKKDFDKQLMQMKSVVSVKEEKPDKAVE